MNKNNLHLRRRFVSDYSLPIQVIDSPYFEYYLDLYDSIHITQKRWDDLCNMIKEDFNDDENEWLAYYANVRDEIINTISKSPAYLEFNECDMNKYSIPKTFNVPDRDIYNYDNNHQWFLSIDLKKANFQALKYHNPDIVLNSETYDNFIDKFTKSQYMRDSKYTRQVIFGKLNPKRTMTIEQWLMYQVAQIKSEMFNFINEIGGELISFKSDELIYKFKDDKCKDIFNHTFKFREDVIKSLGVEVHLKLFKLDIRAMKTENGKTIPAYLRLNPMGGFDTKSIPVVYYPQFFKTLLYPNKGWVNENDLTFYYEGQLSTFKNKLTVVEII